MQQGGPINTQDMQIIALIAYLQRLGTDISRPDAPPPSAAPAPGTEAAPLAVAQADVAQLDVKPVGSEEVGTVLDRTEVNRD